MDLCSLSFLCRGPGQACSVERTGTSLTWEEVSAGVLLTQQMAACQRCLC